MPNKPSPQSGIRFPLNGILGSEANVRVLRELVLSEQALSTSALASRTGLSSVGARNALNVLLEWKVMRRLGSARSVVFQINDKHPLRGALEDLFVAERSIFTELIRAIEEQLDRLGPGLLAAWLYGSVAKERDRPTSDVDIAIVTRRSERSRLKDRLTESLATVAESLAVDPRVVALDIEDLERLARGDPLWTELVRHAVPLMGARPEALLARTAGKRSGHKVKA